MKLPFARQGGKPRLVLHVGTMKTGSTSIQKTLHAHRAVLLKGGVLYPDPARGDKPHLSAHNFLYTATRNGAGAMAAERQRILEEFNASGARAMVLSDEDLSLPGGDPQAMFRPWMDLFDITVFCLLRRQDRFAESLYAEYVRQDFPVAGDGIEAFVRDPDIVGRFDYPALLKRWEGVGGIVAMDFDRAKTDGLHAPLLRAAGMKGRLHPAEQARHNTSPPAEAIEMFRQMHRLDLPHSRPHVIYLVRGALAEDTRRSHFLGSELRRQVLELAAPHNARLLAGRNIRFTDTLPDEPPEPFRLDLPETALRVIARASMRLKVLNNRVLGLTEGAEKPVQ